MGNICDGLAKTTSSEVKNFDYWYQPLHLYWPSTNYWYWPNTTAVTTSLVSDIQKLPKLENNKVTIEVPGFTKDDLVIELKDGDLIVTGSVKKDGYSKVVNQYVYVGDVEVTTAKLVDGLLVIETEPVETSKKLIAIE